MDGGKCRKCDGTGWVVGAGEPTISVTPCTCPARYKRTATTLRRAVIAVFPDRNPDDLLLAREQAPRRAERSIVEGMRRCAQPLPDGRLCRRALTHQGECSADEVKRW